MAFISRISPLAVFALNLYSQWWLAEYTRNMTINTSHISWTFFLVSPCQRAAHVLTEMLMLSVYNYTRLALTCPFHLMGRYCWSGKWHPSHHYSVARGTVQSFFSFISLHLKNYTVGRKWGIGSLPQGCGFKSNLRSVCVCVSIQGSLVMYICDKNLLFWPCGNIFWFLLGKLSFIKIFHCNQKTKIARSLVFWTVSEKLQKVELELMGFAEHERYTCNNSAINANHAINCPNVTGAVVSIRFTHFC